MLQGESQAAWRGPIKINTSEFWHEKCQCDSLEGALFVLQLSERNLPSVKDLTGVRKPLSLWGYSKITRMFKLGKYGKLDYLHADPAWKPRRPLQRRRRPCLQNTVWCEGSHPWRENVSRRWSCFHVSSCFEEFFEEIWMLYAPTWNFGCSNPNIISWAFSPSAVRLVSLREE